MSSQACRRSFLSTALTLLSYSYALATNSAPSHRGGRSVVAPAPTFPKRPSHRSSSSSSTTSAPLFSSSQQRWHTTYLSSSLRGGDGNDDDDESPSALQRRLPDYLTYARCVAIPLIAVLFYDVGGVSRRWFRCSSEAATSCLFAAASFTDWLDGYLARRWRVSTAFGAFLDPVADKLMVSTALLLLSGRYGALVALPSAVILAREIAVSALREWMAQRGLRDVVKVGFQGKLKTAGTMVGLVVLMSAQKPSSDLASALTTLSPFTGGMALLYLSALLTVTSGSVYFRAAAPVLLEKE